MEDSLSNFFPCSDRKICRWFSFALLCFVTAAAPISAQRFTGNQSDISQILQASQRFSNYIIRSAYDSLGASYTIDAKILPPGTRIIIGRDSITRYWIRPEGVSTIQHRAIPSEITVTGDFAHDIGYYEGVSRQKDGTEIPFYGKYVILWKRVNGKWFMYADMWNPVKV